MNANDAAARYRDVANEPTWTKGPWEFGRAQFTNTPAVQGRSHSIVCVLDGHAGVEADGALIAAAPTMFEALVESRRVLARALKAAAPDFYESEDDIAEHLTIQKIDSALRAALSQGEGQ